MRIEGEVASRGETGVEMEAMTVVTVTRLTVFNICKAASKGIQITDVQLKHKNGGKSGDWFNPGKQCEITVSVTPTLLPGLASFLL